MVVMRPLAMRRLRLTERTPAGAGAIRPIRLQRWGERAAACIAIVRKKHESSSQRARAAGTPFYSAQKSGFVTTAFPMAPITCNDGPVAVTGAAGYIGAHL